MYVDAIEYHTTIIKDESLLFTTIWMKLEGLMLIKVSHREIINC